MKFRRLVIRVQTTDGPYGVTLDFPDGLVVIWADNSMGKSTCVKSILVALGMEAMLTTAQSELPLPPAVRTRLESDQGEFDVLESQVHLEIENKHGQRIVASRTVVGSRDKNLITVFEGAGLTLPGVPGRSLDLFVNRDGGATRNAGFHHYLATFLGWTLPKVQTFDGRDYPLYLQCIFPYFVVEQTRGWSTIQPPLPTQFRIRDAHKRSVEFLLDLTAHGVALQRQELQLRQGRIAAEWTSLTTQISELAEGAAGIIQSLPKAPTAVWPPSVPVRFAIPVGETWISLNDRIAASKVELARVIQEEVPRIEDIAVSAQIELEQAERDVRNKQSLLSRLLDVLELEQQENSRVEHRLNAIDEDIQRHKDVYTLQKLGSRQDSDIDSGLCPVCHQLIHDSLVPISSEQSIMTLDENIEFLEEQRRVFTLVMANSKRVAEGRAAQVRALYDDLDSVRASVRGLRATLVSDARLPSAAAIRNRIELENRIRKDELDVAQFDKLIGRFRPLSDQWRQLLSDIAVLPKDDLTDQDKSKISAWAEAIKSQLNQYAFKSFPVSRVVMSQDSYRPEHDGFDIETQIGMERQKPQANSALQTNISASDLIRTIWSYLNGMLEVSRTTSTNHPGCLIFDEPRQQSTRDGSFLELLRRASNAKSAKQQVVFFTSENLERLKAHLNSLPTETHKLVVLEGRVLKKIYTA